MRRSHIQHSPACHFKPRRRAGWTLIEMLVTISVMAVLTGIAIKTLSTMLIAERNGVQHVVDLATVSRLARQFRKDVHAAAAVELNADSPTKPLLQVTVSEGHQIHYQSDAAGLLRTEVRPNQPASRELWRLKQTEFKCQTASEGPPIVTLMLIPNLLQKDIGKSKLVRKEMHIDALRGRDRQPTE